MNQPVLEATNLRKEFRVRRSGARGADAFVAVDDISFTLPKGGAIAIVGESGSGKTTLARMIAGLETPTSGSVRVDGVDRPTGRLSASARLAASRQLQMVFQDPYSSLDPRQDVRHALDEVLRLHHGGSASGRSDRVNELMHQVGLDARHADLRPRSLSGGQRQRVAIARALAVEPAVLILDEAVAALDVSIQAQILNLLNALRAQIGVAYIFVTHDLAVAQHVSDTTLVMRSGQAVECGRSEELLSAPQDEYTQRLLAAVPRIGWTPRRRRGGTDA
jgi:peptide/nickel transport system ATP-binding protein